MEGPAVERLLARAVSNEDALTASNAIEACRRRRDPTTGAAITAALDDPRWPVRLAARRAAGSRGGGLPWWAFGMATKTTAGGGGG
jgi:hypothetical protein